ncbi:Ethylene-responsive transcription factor-like protein [Heracleum sosnowskyi]|uniref:Ethylene-responsive transcription factor-like protein n=1 Tax=Heracleum sosnowskyi TaxID=360622 RepID=A0AAD8J8Z8_9APIA|nr:Ethylene-responsive transcription factor-like protein [Heracleum sosnowskyi]
MVSIRRRKLLGLCSGRSSFVDPLPKPFDSGHTPEKSMKNSTPFSVHPVPCIDFDQVKENGVLKVHPGSSNMSTSSSSKEQHHEQFSGISTVVEFKRRKRYRRKQFENQEPCIMRGVYYKNMKWQAAIKVEKKQIHLGTVCSQEEAARLYDRAAFMCGREPNFKLSEEDKEELKKLSWDEYLAITRSEIASKKQQRRTRVGSRRKVEAVDNGYCDVDEAGFSGPED